MQSTTKSPESGSQMNFGGSSKILAKGGRKKGGDVNDDSKTTKKKGLAVFSSSSSPFHSIRCYKSAAKGDSILSPPSGAPEEEDGFRLELVT